jgi:hypothetical protein
VDSYFQVVEETDYDAERLSACLRISAGALLCGTAAAASTWVFLPLIPCSAATSARAATAAAVGVGAAATVVGVAAVSAHTRHSSSGHGAPWRQEPPGASAYSVELGKVGSAGALGAAPEAMAIVRPQLDGDAHRSPYGAIS